MDPLNSPAAPQPPPAEPVTGGPPGWIWPNVFSAVVAFATFKAALGDSAAHRFLVEALPALTPFVLGSFTTWLGYRGWRHHSRNKLTAALAVGQTCPSATAIAVAPPARSAS